MRVVFFGTPDFAVPSLEKLTKSNHNVVGVVTAPDKKRGRGRKLSYTPVKEFAVQNDIMVLQPEKMKGPDFIESLKALNADLFVVVAFRILPEVIYAMPKKGSFNLHGSLLPKYRGAAPIQWAVMNGDTETGLTTFSLQKKVDTGQVIKKVSLPIEPADNLGTLHDKMSMLGAELVLDTVNMVESGDYKLLPQDDSLATPAPKITKETCQINWNDSADTIHNQIRGLSPYPGAFFVLNEKQYKVYKSELTGMYGLKPGEYRTTKKEIYFGTGEEEISILEIQPEGRKRITAEDFLRGYQF